MWVTKRRLAQCFASLALTSVSMLMPISNQMASASSPTPLCSSSSITGTASTTVRPGAAGVNLTLTTSVEPGCAWSFATSFQFVSTAGMSIGPWATGPASLSVASTLWKGTFPLVVTVNTMQGVQCSVAMANRIALRTSTSRTLLINLDRSIGVCTSNSAKWTSVSSPKFLRAPYCTSNDLKSAIGSSQSGGAVTYTHLEVQNSGSQACVLRGIQTLQAVQSRQNPITIGPPVRVVSASPAGNGFPIYLFPKSAAQANFASSTTNFSIAKCDPAKAGELKMAIYGSVQPLWFDLTANVCTKTVSSSVTGFSLLTGSLK